MPAHPLVPLWLYRTVTVAHYVNVASVAITLILYAIIEYGGIGLQFFLGCYQLALAALVTFAYWKWNIPAIFKLLKVYWIVVLIWIVFAIALGVAANAVHYIEADSLIRPFGIGIFIILPMGIACFFVYVTYRIHYSFKQP